MRQSFTAHNTKFYKGPAMASSSTPSDTAKLAGTARVPLLIERREQPFESNPDRILGAIQRSPDRVQAAAKHGPIYLAGSSGALLLVFQSSRNNFFQYCATEELFITTLASRLVSTPSVDQF